MTGVSTEQRVAALKRLLGDPRTPRDLEVIETHRSWVFLTADHAWKLKKPVRTEFLDFSTPEARRRDADEELRLNRRLAPDVYLAVVPLAVDESGAVSLEGNGRVIDWLVKMRRLPAARMLDRLIVDGRLQPAEIEPLATLLAGFYRRSPRIGFDGGRYRARLDARIRGNYQALSDRRYRLPAALLEELRDRLLAFTAGHAGLLEARAGEWIVEGHGDLRPEHVCLESPPAVFDCLEFNRDFRILDSAAELTFLAMECERLGSATAGELLLQSYRQSNGDDPPAALVSFYKADSALLRAKLSAWHLLDVDHARHDYWLERAAQYLDIAARHARESG